MKFVRAILALVLGLALMAITGCSAAPESTWDAFVAAVEDGRVDDAVSHIHFERLVENTVAEDPEIEAGLELMGGVEGAAAQMETALRDALATNPESMVPKGDKPTAVEKDGDTATLTVDDETGPLTVVLEKIDGAWMIVGFP